MTTLAPSNSAPLALAQAIPAMSEAAISKVRALESVTITLSQVKIATDHVLHAGIYSRTIRIPAGVLLTGALIKVPTTLILSGHASVFIGDETIEICGYRVIPASAARKQAFLAHADTDLTMSFATYAGTVEEAEAEFTDEAPLLFSRNADALNTIRITGE